MDINYEIEHLENILEKHYINNYAFEKDQFNEDVINKENPEEYVSIYDFDEYFPKTIYDEKKYEYAYFVFEWDILKNQWQLGYKWEPTNKWFINIRLNDIKEIKNALSELLNKIKK